MPLIINRFYGCLEQALQFSAFTSSISFLRTLPAHTRHPSSSCFPCKQRRGQTRNMSLRMRSGGRWWVTLSSSELLPSKLLSYAAREQRQTRRPKDQLARRALGVPCAVLGTRTSKRPSGLARSPSVSCFYSRGSVGNLASLHFNAS